MYYLTLPSLLHPSIPFLLLSVETELWCDILWFNHRHIEDVSSCVCAKVLQPHPSLTHVPDKSRLTMRTVLGKPSSDDSSVLGETFIVASSYHLISSIIFGIMAIHSKRVHII